MATAPTQHKISRYGWVPDFPDARDHLYSAPIAAIGPLPAKVDLRPGCPPVYNQGQLGSCTANAIGAAVQFDRKKQGLSPDFMPSRLFIYYNERDIEGTVGNDNGAQIRDGVKSVATTGVCPEDDCPYDIAKFTDKPSPQAYADAARTRVSSYCRVARSLMQMKGCLAAGYPFVFGFSVYDSFEGEEVAQTGVLQMPDLSKETLLGGHAVLAVGYDDAEQRFLVRNSWGDGWGQQGYFTMPYSYLLEANLSDDMWTLRLIAE
ncbi:MAG TPA: C1 family peptidase [Allosphingosinicella sp.]|jgi:C1A family cysteine protease|nr:C1 family peptidase [Allosphingosinicella sp.]